MSLVFKNEEIEIYKLRYFDDYIFEILEFVDGEATKSWWVTLQEWEDFFKNIEKKVSVFRDKAYEKGIFFKNTLLLEVPLYIECRRKNGIKFDSRRKESRSSVDLYKATDDHDYLLKKILEKFKIFNDIKDVKFDVIPGYELKKVQSRLCEWHTGTFYLADGSIGRCDFRAMTYG